MESTSVIESDDSDLEIIENPSNILNEHHSNILDLDNVNHAADLNRMRTAARKTMICPIGQHEIKIPLSAPCGHTFERERLLAYLQSKATADVQCPERGCSRTLRESDFVEVSVVDKVDHDGDNGGEINARRRGSDVKWHCVRCTFIHEQDGIVECVMCGHPREDIGDKVSRKRTRSLSLNSEHLQPYSKRQKLNEEEVAMIKDEEWSCNACTLKNEHFRSRCRLCDTPRMSNDILFQKETFNIV